MKKAAHNGIVDEFLERVSWRALEDYRANVKSMIHGHAGVYALYKAEKLYYVGLARNLMSRVNQHLKDRHKSKWDNFSVYLTSDGDHIRPLESLVLRIVNPDGNRVVGKLRGAKDLVRELKRDMSSADANKRAILLGGKHLRQRRRTKTKDESGTRVLAGLVPRRMPLRADYKGETYRAMLRKNGTIQFGGVLYDAPSAAAIAIVKRNANGWNFWHYRVGRNNWVPLRELRR
jgi:hypothetical protein